MNRLTKILIFLLAFLMLNVAVVFACGTIEMFGSLYFASDYEDGECRLSALDGLMCVTPLPERYYQTPEAQEILRLILCDALQRHELRNAAKTVYQRYLPYDRYGFLKNIQHYRLTSKDHELIEKLKKAGQDRIRQFCSPEKGYFRHYFK